MRLIFLFNWLLSLGASILRLGAGGSAPAATTVVQPIIFYEFEGCPFCRISREAISETGVLVLMKPCPKGGKRFRPELMEIGGKAQFPYMIDPNTNTQMYESADIARYLRKTYGAGGPPVIQLLGPINIVFSQFAVLFRLMGGTIARSSTAPQVPLELYGAERSPSTRIVKELLSEMELEYFWRSRPVGETKTPCLVDPNTGEELTGALEIRRYLTKTYSG